VDGLSVVWSQNLWDGFLWLDLTIDGDGFSWFGLKTGGGFLGSASKPRWWSVSQVGPQNRQLRFGDLGLKIKQTTVCQLYHKTVWRVTVRDTR
jgi:hypothetical protein